MDNKKICPVCETPNFLGAKNCEVCGEPLPIPQAEPGAAPTPPEAEAAEADSAESDQVDTGPKDSGAAAKSDEDSLRELEKFDALLGDTGDAESAGFVRDHDTIVDRKLPEHVSGGKRDAAAGASGAVAGTGFEKPTDTAVTQGPAAVRPASSPGVESPPSAESDETAGTDAASPATPDSEAAESVAATSAAITSGAAEESDEDAGGDTNPDVACARLTIYVDKEPVHHHDIVTDETLVGRSDPTSDAWPELDLTNFDDDQSVSRKHAYIYREAGDYFIYPISNAGTQVGSDLLEIGTKTRLNDGDVVILAGSLAMKFELP